MDYLSEITDLKQLEQAWKHVKRKRKVTPGVDLVSIQEFEKNSSKNLRKIAERAQQRKYKFDSVIQKKIPKGKGTREKRPIRIYTVGDKILQTSIRISFEKDRLNGRLFPEVNNKISVGYLDKNYNHGDGVGVRLAISKLREFHGQGYHRFIVADIKNFFDVIDRERLRKKIFSRLSPDKSINYLVEQLLNPVVIEKDRFGNNIPLMTTNSGVAQGSVISPFLSNVYLMDFDIALQDAGIHAVRYADDLIIASKKMYQAKNTLTEVKKILKDKSDLEFHPDGTKKGPHITNIHEGFDYLGVNIKKTPKSNRWSICPSKEKTRIQRDKILEELNPFSNTSLYSRIHKLNSSLSSWFSTYHYVGCSKKELSSLYREFKDLYASHVGHLLVIKKIAKGRLTRSQMDFLGVMPPQVIFKKRNSNGNPKKL